MSTLEKAIAVASLAHTGQTDKEGKPYILHPLRVMFQMKTTDEKIVAILHDVLEDTELNVKDLRSHGFSNEIIEGILSVTRNEGETYFEFINRVKKNELGRKVKLADLKDNMNWDRIKQPTEEDMKRMQKYQKAYFILLK